MIVLYSTGCPMCGLLKTELEKANIEFTVCADTVIMEDRGMTRVPMLEVNNELYDLNEALEWIGENKNV